MNNYLCNDSLPLHQLTPAQWGKLTAPLIVNCLFIGNHFLCREYCFTEILEYFNYHLHYVIDVLKKEH